MATKDGFTLPGKMDARDQALYDRLSKLTSRKKDFASRTLPTLQEHLKMVENISGTLISSK